MKPDQKIELFLSLLAYSTGSWKAEDVILAYEYLKKETNGEVLKMPPRLETEGSLH